MPERVLDTCDEVQQRHRVVVADIEHPIRCIAGRRIGLQRIVCRVRRGNSIGYPDDTLHDVVHIGEVTLHVAVIEHVNGAAFQNGLGEQEQRHVRATPGAIHREKSQSGRGQSIQMAVRMRHQLIGLLGRRIQTYRVIYAVVFRERHLGIAAIHAGTGGIRQVLHTAVPASFEHIHKPHNVAVNVGMRVLERVAHAGLGG